MGSDQSFLIGNTAIAKRRDAESTSLLYLYTVVCFQVKGKMKIGSAGSNMIHNSSELYRYPVQNNLCGTHSGKDRSFLVIDPGLYISLTFLSSSSDILNAGLYIVAIYLFTKKN